MPAAKAPTEHRPNLAGVISPEDLFKKNGHDYVAWARIANYLHTNANGWECNMRLAPDGSHVWKAPNGTAYLVLYFTGPEAQVTADFPYAITDFRNKALKLEQIDSAAFCNSQRRGFAACAAFTFGLGYELWAREEVTADEPASVPANGSSSDSPRTASKKKAAPTPAAVVNPPADPLAERKSILQRKLGQYAAKDPDLKANWVASMRNTFEAATQVEALNIAWLHTEEQVAHTELFVSQYEANLRQSQAA